MTTTAPATERPALDDAALQAAEAFAGRLFTGGVQALELFTVWLGDALGLYRALAEAGDANAADLANAAGINERYAREWLEQQAVCELIEVAVESDDDARRRYRLPRGHQEVLLEPDSPFALGGLAHFLPSVGRVADALLDAYRSGGGVPYADYGVHDVQAALTRPGFVNELVPVWLAATPDVVRALQGGGRVAEIACGEGFAAVAIAQAFPKATVDAFDLDDASIARARSIAAEAGVADRVRFEVRDAADPTLRGDYDLVVIFEALHDVPRPVELLQTMRRLRGPGGAVLVVDEKVQERFTAPGDDVERFMYTASVLHCLPVGMVDEGSAATGTVIRASTVERYATAAGFTSVEELAIDNMMWRFYRLEG